MKVGKYHTQKKQRLNWSLHLKFKVLGKNIKEVCSKLLRNKKKKKKKENLLYFQIVVKMVSILVQ